MNQANWGNQNWGGGWGQPAAQPQTTNSQPSAAAPVQSQTPAAQPASSAPQSVQAAQSVQASQGWGAGGVPAQRAYAPQQGHPPAQPAYDPLHAARVKAGVNSMREKDFLTPGKYVLLCEEVKYTDNMQYFVGAGRVLWADGLEARAAGGTWSFTRRLDPIGMSDVNQFEGVLLHGLDPRRQEDEIIAAISANPSAMPLAMADARTIPHPVIACSAWTRTSSKTGKTFTICNFRVIPPEILARIQADQGVQDPSMLASIW